MKREPTGAEQTADFVQEFLVAAIHATLHRRGLYPPEMFVAARLFEVRVHRCRYPALCAYVSDVVSSTRPWLLDGSLKALALCVHGPDAALIERHVFELGLRGAASQPGGGSLPGAGELVALQRALGEALLRHAAFDAFLQPAPLRRATFSLVAFTSHASPDPAFKWAVEGGALPLGGGASAVGGPPPLPRRSLTHSLDAQRSPLMRLDVRAERPEEEARDTG